ncbi:MAG: 5-bromo-4-chloroindolyl phosphate hydrolysis family protein [Christensenellales bacterium]|jgi:5-bromo-4-chloroindolyl phosphate hydrolysis protein
MKEKTRTIIAVIISLIAFYILSSVLKWNTLVAGLIAVVLYFAVFLLLKPVLRIGSTNVENIRGGETMHRMMSDAHEDIQSIYIASQNIRDKDIKQKAEKLHELGSRILKYLNDNPSSIPEARRFFTYYLDTGQNILNKYMRLENSNPGSAEIKELSEKTSRGMDILYDAFTKQFSRLMRNELMDVEADIKMLEESLEG